MPSSLSPTCIVAAVLRVPGLSEVQQFQRFHRALDRRTWLARQASRRLLMPSSKPLPRHAPCSWRRTTLSSGNAAPRLPPAAFTMIGADAVTVMPPRPVACDACVRCWSELSPGGGGSGRCFSARGWPRGAGKGGAASRPAHSFSMPALRMISPHFCASAAWNFASSSGDVTNTSVPLVA